MHKRYFKIALFFGFLILLTALHFSCNDKKESIKSQDISIVDSAPIPVIHINTDSLTIIIPGENSVPLPKKVLAGQPKIVSTNTNVHPVSGLKQIPAGIPMVYTPGQDSLLLPKTVLAIDSPFIAGVPEIVIAKDPYIRDQNPENFSSFGKLQGLKHSGIYCMLEDHSGNLWFGTGGGGVSKYDGKTFTHFTEKEGLSNNYVFSILEDQNGTLWFGTGKGGVSKYDGKTFTHFTEKEGLSYNSVYTIIEDRNGNLWFGTYGGGVSKLSLSVVEGCDTYTFTHYTEKQGLANNMVYSIVEDHNGNLWFGTSGGVSKFDGSSFTNYTKKEGLSDIRVLSILEDRSGNLWFGTYGGGVTKLTLSEVDGKDTYTHITQKEGLSNNYVSSILEDQSGSIWFGTEGGGVSKLDLSEVEGSYTFTHYTEKEGLSNINVMAILEDQSGTLWFGTHGGGVSKYDGKSFTHFTQNEGLSDNQILSILKDKSGTLWFGTEGGGVSKFDGKNFTHYTEKEGLSNNNVFSIVEDHKGNIWFGTYGGGVSKFDGKSFTHFTQKEGLSDNYVWAMLEDHRGNMWFGTYGGGVSKLTQSEVQGNETYTFTHFTENEGLSNNYVFSIFEDHSGNLWFGTNGGGVSKLAQSKVEGNETYSFTHFTENEGLSNNYVRSILEDQSGNLWFGTNGGGVTLLVVKHTEGFAKSKTQISRFFENRQIINLTEKEGLSGDNVFSMMFDNDRNLFIGTRFGLSKIEAKDLADISVLLNKSANPTTPICKNWGYEDGFLGIGVNSGKTMCESNDGKIWIGSNDRLTVYHPEGHYKDTIPPNVQLTSIELFNQNIGWVNLAQNKDTSFTLGNGVKVGDFQFEGITQWYGLPENLSLAYNNNYLTFNYIGIKQKQSKKVKYQYILEGIDKNWSALTSRTSAPYGNLPHGTYKFKVKAMNSEGYWSKEFTYTIEIRPPWWKTWWFRTIYIALSLLFLIGFYLWRTAALRKRQKELVKKVKEATIEINEKNEELQQQNEEILSQRDAIEQKNEALNQLIEEVSVQRDVVTQQKEQIEEIHHELTDSINYAKRIQNSALPDLKPIKKSLSDIFILFKPKDVVSGDFYWYAEVENKIIITVADCTGHGVPGAFMSMMGISMLKEIVVKEYITQPDVILRKLRKEVINALGQTGASGEPKDGMDMSICSINKETLELQWAGANNPLLLVQKRELAVAELVEVKPDKMPIAIYEKMDKFTLHEKQLKKGDIIYLIGDGYVDQFGGPKGKKFMSKKLKELLLEISNKPMKEQHDILDQTIIDWMSGYGEQYEQTDDITLMGIKI